jgi:hypothetical protein
MLSRICAAWLVAIIALPFTAPLATCDVADILLRAPGNADAPARSEAPSADRNTTTTPILITPAGQLRLNVVSDTIVASAPNADIFVASIRAIPGAPQTFEHRAQRQRILRL